MSVQEAGVYWPFKSLLTGSGITITETPTSITIGTTGAGPGGGDMLSSVYATNGAPGVVDKAVSAQTVTGVVAHATLADSVPWGGVTGKPTVFPSDWGSITNKPSAFTPLPHALTHISTGSDVIPIASSVASGLVPVLSSKNTDYLGGDGAFHALGTYPLICQAGLTVQGTTTLQGILTAQAGATLLGGTTVQGGLTADNLSVTTLLQVTNGSFQVNDPTGIICGIYNTGANNAVLSLANGSSLTKSACYLVKQPNTNALAEAALDGSGNQIYQAEILTTYNPSGMYNFRAGTRLTGYADIAGNASAYAQSPFIASSVNSGGFCGFGMVSSGYWGCCVGAWQSGLWIATSAGTFVQLTDNYGHIPGTALQAGAALANLSNSDATISPPNRWYFSKTPTYAFIGGAAWTDAPLVVMSPSGARAGMAFYAPGSGQAMALVYVADAGNLYAVRSDGLVSQITGTASNPWHS